jgi:hypothetical protein
MVDLGTLGGSTSRAEAVNETGWVVSTSSMPSGVAHAVLWRAPTAPTAPTAVTAAAGDGQATVAFAAPASDGGNPIRYYTATSSPDGLSASGTSSPITVYGLTNGTTYTFAVTASNAIETGPLSPASDPVVPEGHDRPHADPPPADTRPPVPEPPTATAPRPPLPHH